MLVKEGSVDDCWANDGTNHRVFVHPELEEGSARRAHGIIRVEDASLCEVQFDLCAQGSTFPGARGHMPIDFAVGS